MLYIGNFSFDYDDPDGQERQGRFIYVLEADSADDAVNKFQKNLNNIIKKEPNLLHGKIYLDGALEINSLPQKGVLAFWKTSSDIQTVSLGSYLPLNSRGVKCFEWYPDGKEPPPEEGDYTPDPFIIAPNSKKKRSRKT